jgi:capsular exopolysaccharide synthesis family protein
MSDFKSLLNRTIVSIPELGTSRASVVAGTEGSPASFESPASQRDAESKRGGPIHLPQARDSIGLDEIFARLWQRRKSVLSAALAGLVTGALITAICTPVYRARTAIRLEGLNDRYQNLADIFPFSTIAANGPGEAYLQNELKVLESQTLARRVANRLEIESAQSPGPPVSPSPLSKLLARLDRGRLSPSADDLRIKAVERALTVRSSLKSQVVEIFFDSPDPARAAAGANSVVSEYVAINREAQLNTAHDTTEWLAEQISDLKTKLDKENNQLQAFAASSGLLYSANQSSLTEQRVREIQEELSKAQAERASRQSRYETAVSNSPESLPDGSENSLLREYDANLAAAQRDLIQFRSMYMPEHYKVIDAEARVAQLEAAIRVERKHIIERMRAEYDSAGRFERSLESTYHRQTRKLESQTADTFRYNVLKHDLDSTQQLYDSLLHKAKEAGVTSALHATTVRVIDPARPPDVPYSPNLPLNCAVGLSSGLFLAITVILIQDRGRIDHCDDPRILSIRELGVIPAAKCDPLLNEGSRRLLTGGLEEKATVEMVSWHEQGSLLTESYRSALTSILFSAGFQRRNCVVAVTSVEPQEGKTTTLTNLGIALTETHARVLLIDADLRRPGLHKIFEHCNDTGLTTLLTGKEPITDVRLRQLVHATKVPGLFIIPSGPGCANLTRLLHSTRIGAFLACARKEFDFTLIDTPPTSLFSDARILGKLSDSVVFVFRAGKTSRDALNAACLQFLDDGVGILGAIRNRSEKSSRKAYDYYGYGSA